MIASRSSSLGFDDMNIDNILKPGSALKRAFVNLESGMSDAFDEAFLEASLDAEPDGGEGLDRLVQPTDSGDAIDAQPEMEADLDADDEAPAVPEDVAERITAHTRSRLAAFAIFDESRSAVHKDLDQIGAALANVTAAHHLSREFLNDCYADIQRANDMEVQNAALSAHARRQADRLDKLERQRVRYEALVDMQKRREAKFVHEAAALRDELNVVKLDAVEARNLLARSEAQHGELHTALSAKTSLAERLLRENEVLRDKGVTASLDLENAVKKQADIRRKYDDLFAIHAEESARYAEMAAKLSTAESELSRIQKVHDGLEARLADATEQLGTLELEMSEREKRYQTENHALKGENHALGARLLASTTEHLDAVSEIEAIKTRLSNLDSEKHLAEKKYAALSAEIENGRNQGGSDGADQALVEMQKQEIASLRGEIEVLTEKLKRLLPLEKRQEAAKTRTRGKAEFPETFGSGNGAHVGVTPDMPKQVHSGM